MDLEVVLHGADGGDGPREEVTLGLRGPVLTLPRCTPGQRNARLQEDAGRLHEPGNRADREGRVRREDGEVRVLVLDRQADRPVGRVALAEGATVLLPDPPLLGQRGPDLHAVGRKVAAPEPRGSTQPSE
eukprot:2621219-Alexandrium_andersonii.AAC.1